MKRTGRFRSPLLLVAVSVIVFLGMTACGNKENVKVESHEGMETNIGSYISVPMSEGLGLMDSDRREGRHFVIVDVRRQDEYDSGHIPGAVLLTNELITEELALSVLPDRGCRIYVYCRSGRRSKEASGRLAALGYRDIVEFGGILDYSGEMEL